MNRKFAFFAALFSIIISTLLGIDVRFVLLFLIWNIFKTFHYSRHLNRHNHQPETHQMNRHFSLLCSLRIFPHSLHLLHQVDQQTNLRNFQLFVLLCSQPCNLRGNQVSNHPDNLFIFLPVNQFIAQPANRQDSLLSVPAIDHLSNRPLNPLQNRALNRRQSLPLFLVYNLPCNLHPILQANHHLCHLFNHHLHRV